MRRGTGPLLGVLLALTALAGALAVAIRGGGQGAAGPPVAAGLSVAAALGGPVDPGFARAGAPRPFAFPADAGPHPAFRTEWWYWTGNLTGAGAGAGRRFGFQLTFFRTALAAAPPPRVSAWATRDVYLAHFALADVSGRRFHAAERWSRAALDLAGARAAPFRVWLASWAAEEAGPGGWPLRLEAAAGDVGMALALSSAKPPVLQGEHGLSRKGPAPGQASYYYSLTRMPVTGTVRLGSATIPVEGLAWMDREWSTSALGPEQVGWDWFALQLDDGRELMLYRLRRRDGSVDPASAGTLVAADGTARSLAAADAEVEVLARWASPRDGTRYPARWRLRVPSAGLALTVTPWLPDQELQLGVRYWEGAVRVEGSAGDRPLSGAGYVELVGYATAAEEAVRQ